MYLYGASGHGKVIKEILEAQGREVDAFVDDNLSISSLCNKPVVHSGDGLSPMIVSVGVNATRRKIVEKLSCEYGVAIHPSAIVSPSALIGEGTVVMAGAVINAGAVIGKHCIINTGATVDHECVIEDFVHIAPGVHLCGQVNVGEGTLIGVGSSAIPCISIGKWCVIGAGSVVIKDIPDDVVCFGNPARVLGKQLDSNIQ